jgi:hypothetical protein
MDNGTPRHHLAISNYALKPSIAARTSLQQRGERGGTKKTLFAISESLLRRSADRCTFQQLGSRLSTENRQVII